MPLTLKRKEQCLQESELTPDETRILECFKLHINYMLTDDWYITLDFGAEVGEEPMATTAKPEYRSAAVDIEMKEMEGQWDYLAHHVRHELLHIIVWSFFDIAGTLTYKNAKQAMVKLEESVIDRLEHMPLWSKLYEK